MQRAACVAGAATVTGNIDEVLLDKAKKDMREYDELVARLNHVKAEGLGRARDE